MRRLLLAVLLAGGCGGEEAAPPAPAGPLRPGDTLLDRVAGAQLLNAPVTSLPSALASAADEALASGSLRVRTATLRSEQWIPGRLVPEVYRPLLGADPSLRLWNAQPGVRPRAEAVPGVLRDGQPVAEWIAASQAFPGEAFWWDPAERTLRAVGRAPPAGIALEFDADPRVELAGLEPGRLFRVEMGRQSRPCLLLPAPSELVFELPALLGDTLHVAVGALDRGWSLQDGAFTRGEGRSDGLAFVLLVRDAEGERELWRKALPPAALGRGFVEAAVDVRELAGRPLSLVLRTEAGATPDFDYGLWGELRLAGPPAGSLVRRPPHVVLIDVDTLRADRLSAYGAPRLTTPRLDAWAARRALLLEDARSTASFTLPATASMLTGLAVHQHGVDHLPRALGAATPTLAARLREAGYETRALVEGAYVSAAFGFDQGFDLFETATYKRPDWEPVIEWLDARQSEKPFFLFLHTYLVHAPYEHDPRFAGEYRGPWLGQDIGPANVIEPFRAGTLELDPADREYVSSLYDALVARVDGLVAGLLEQLDQRFGPDELVVLITSDHGEEFFEHGGMAHGHSLYGELLHVPLLVAAPGLPPGRSAAPASLLDVVPTVLDAVGLPVPPGLPGTSLLAPEGRGGRPLVAQFSDGVHSIERDGRKLVRGPIPGPRGASPPVQLFDLGSDPGEQRDLAPGEPESVRRLDELLDAWLAQWPPPAASPADAELADSAWDALNALGYIGGH